MKLTLGKAKLTFGKALVGLSLGAFLTFSPVLSQQAAAGPFGAVRAAGDVSALPLVDVQARRAARRPVRPVQRANRGNRRLAAGALIGAAILGGAIFANSQRSRPQQPQYFYTPEGYLVDAYGNPVQQRPQRGYRQPQYEYEQPAYYQPPRQRYRQQPVESYNPGYQPPRVRYNQPRGGAGSPYVCSGDSCVDQSGNRVRGRGLPSTGGPTHPTTGG